MIKFVRRAAMAALLVSTASLAVVTTVAPVDAAQRGNAKQTGPTTRPQIGRPLTEAITALNMMDYATALAKTQIADKIDKKTPYEEYLVAKILGAIALGKPERDFPAATTAYMRMMASNGAPDMDKEQMYSVGMKLAYQANLPDKVVEAAAALKMIRPLDDTDYEVLVQTYYKKEDFQNTIATAKEANAAAIAAGRRPDPSVLGMLLNSQAKSMDPGYRQTLDELATVSKQPEVWGQVMDFALATKDLSDHHVLNIFRLALRVGTMRDTDYAAMATIDLMNGMATEGKAVLEKAIAAGTIKREGVNADLIRQANGLVGAEQKTLPDLAAEAGKAPNGEIYMKLGESYWMFGQFPQAVDAIQKGIAKGGIKDQGDAYTTLGIVLMDAGRQAEALEAFNKAEMLGGTGANVAHAWNLFSRRAA